MHSSGSAFSRFASSVASGLWVGLPVTESLTAPHLVLAAMTTRSCRETRDRRFLIDRRLNYGVHPSFCRDRRQWAKLSINLLIISSVNRLVYKFSKNSKRCPPQLQTQSEPVYYHTRQRKAADSDILEAEPQECFDLMSNYHKYLIIFLSID